MFQSHNTFNVTLGLILTPGHQIHIHSLYSDQFLDAGSDIVLYLNNIAIRVSILIGFSLSYKYFSRKVSMYNTFQLSFHIVQKIEGFL